MAPINPRKPEGEQRDAGTKDVAKDSKERLEVKSTGARKDWSAALAGSSKADAGRCAEIYR